MMLPDDAYFTQFSRYAQPATDPPRTGVATFLARGIAEVAPDAESESGSGSRRP